MITEERRWVRVTDVGDDDGTFDREFWHAQGPEAIFAAAWDMVLTAHMIKGGDPNELEFQRSYRIVEQT